MTGDVSKFISHSYCFNTQITVPIPLSDSRMLEMDHLNTNRTAPSMWELPRELNLSSAKCVCGKDCLSANRITTSM